MFLINQIIPPPWLKKKYISLHPHGFVGLGGLIQSDELRKGIEKLDSTGPKDRGTVNWMAVNFQQ